MKVTVRLTMFPVLDTEVVGQHKVFGEVGLVIDAVVAGADDRFAVVVDDLAHFDPDVGSPSPLRPNAGSRRYRGSRGGATGQRVIVGLRQLGGDPRPASLTREKILTR